jgi:hypothetical protein
MRDRDLRGRLLKVFYDRRLSNGGWVPVSENDLAGGEPIDLQTIGTICEHMAQAGLIEWKPLRDGTGYAAGMAKITGHGVDVIDRAKAATIEITLPSTTSNATLAPEILRVVSSPAVASETVSDPTELSPVAPRLGEPTASPITPTVYPDDPNEPITVQQHISVDVQSVAFRDFSDKIEEIIGELRKSNIITGQVRDKLVAEISMGMTLIKSPKPDPKLLDMLLKRPLMYIADKAGSAVIGALASAAALLLAKAVGLF